MENKSTWDYPDLFTPKNNCTMYGVGKFAKTTESNKEKKNFPKILHICK